MCEIIEIGLREKNKNISIEYQRDAALRLTELVVINRDRDGQETGVAIMCTDKGNIRISQPVKLQEGVALVGPFSYAD